jgi:hypothetical protein
MAAYTSEGAQLADAGKMLGRLVRDHLARTYEDFVRLVVEDPCPLRNVVLHLAYTRKPLSGATTLLDDLNAPTRPRRTEYLLRDAWAMYRTLRQHACPRAEQPVVQPGEGAVQFTRATSAFLRPSGVRTEHAEWRASERKRLAQERLLELWGAMAGRGCVLWYDNFYKRLYHATPRQPMTSLNTTVMSVMRRQTDERPTGFEGYPSLEQLWNRLDGVAQDLCDAATDRLPALFRDVGAQPLGAGEFRVPLDVPRQRARAPVWRPFNLSADIVSSQVGMLRVLRFLRDTVLPHVQAPLPLLVDVNLWYRQVKLVYGREAQRWEVAAALEQLPPLYGVWHAYKQVLHVLYRRLLPLFVYVQRGSQPPGANWMEHPRTRTLECWIGALLMLPADRRLRLSAFREWLVRRRDRMREEVAERDTKVLEAERLKKLAEEKAKHLRSARGRSAGRHREELDRAERLEQRNTRAWEQAVDHRRRVLQDLRAVRRDLAIVQALVDLVTVWAPAVFALGWRVRDCHWKHRQVNTGSYAKETLRTAFLLLFYLEGPSRSEPTLEVPTAGAASSSTTSRPPAPPPSGRPSSQRPPASVPPPPSTPAPQPRGALSEYLRTLGCALLTWTPWHSHLPACCYSEELTEAALGRLGQSMREHPDATTTDAVMDLWLRVKPGQAGFKAIESGGVDEQWRRMVADHVDQLLDRTDPALPRDRRERVADVLRYVGRARRTAAPQAAEAGGEADDEAEGEAVETESAWPPYWAGPEVMTADGGGWRQVQSDLHDVLRRSLLTLMLDHTPADATVVELDALCPRRDDDTLEAYQAAWDLTADRHHPQPRVPPAPTANVPAGSTCSGDPKCFRSVG